MIVDYVDEHCEVYLISLAACPKPKSGFTTKYKKQFVSALKDLKQRHVISQHFNEDWYTKCEQSPGFYGLPKEHKPSMPLKLTVSTIGCVWLTQTTINNY